ncbi:MAG: RusA family crossover junction endodeoxyribonuclease [Nonomuraea sp.]|nr:RusA family crossover junction endodeoxyribonuclease [Nonomuraea sp.]NUQ32234.1 RusA family crossover junction endodeoxyribonuclease [Dermatophilaceae bacterium]NUR81071.1 RusA family crossover junction endodeoxyribonuclease [Dermatophilaceae bacterium]
MSRLAFTVNGIPGAQGSKRHLGNGVLLESSKKVKPWRSDVKAAAEAALIASDTWDHCNPSAVDVTVTFLFQRPKSHYRTGARADQLRDDAPYYVTSRAAGDLDKLLRSSLDALTAAGVIADDSLVVTIIANKRYTRRNERPGALFDLITVRNLDRLEVSERREHGMPPVYRGQAVS